MDYYKDNLEILLKGLMILILLATSADAATLNVPADYSTIQAAVNAATAGDTILVQSGTYYEKVNVNKALILQGVDSGSGLPVVDAGGLGDAITLRANGCILQDFMARNSSGGSSGIKVASSYNTISGNTATGNNIGIYLLSSSGNTISGNIAIGNTYGIYLYSSIGNTISGNNATGNSYCGIYLYSSIGNTITGNTITGNTAGNSVVGIYLYYSSNNNTITGNTATGCYYGISLYSSSSNTIIDNTATSSLYYGIYFDSSSNSNTISGNTATGNGCGIYLKFSSNNTLSDNTATGNGGSIYLEFSSNNTLLGNIAAGNRIGIYLDSSGGNNISGNTATGNTEIGIVLETSSNDNTLSGNTASGNSLYGIYLDSSSGNTIYLNTFNNAKNAWSNGANHWNATSSQTYEQGGRNLTGLFGNIWSDYDGVDCDRDGMGETPYDISGGSEKDYHPLGGSEAGAMLEVEKIADRSEAGVGDGINYVIWVNNTGKVTLNGIRAYDNLTGDVWQVGDLPPGGNYTNTTRYQVNLSDLPGPLTNELQANGTDPCGSEVNASAIDTVNIIGQNLTCIEGYKLDVFGNKLSGWKIFADLDNDGILDPGEPSDITDSNGYWQICGLDAGEEYNVTEILKTGWIPSDPPSGWQVITVQPNNDTDVNFTNQETTYCIAGQKLNNLTKEPLEGWTITVSNDSRSWQVQTNSTGFWELCGLGGGNYTVCEENRSGWMQVYPIGCYEVIDLAAIIDNSGPITGVSFYNEPIDLCLSGHKFHYRTNKGLAGWTIVVSNTTDRWEIITDAAGFWQKCNLTPGDYKVCEVLQPGWVQVSPNGCYNPTLVDKSKSISNLDFYNDAGCNLTLTKTADKETAKRGEDVTYNITLSKPCDICFNNTTLWDQLPDRVQVVSVSPGPSSSSGNTLYWDLGTFCSEEFKVQIVVRVPIVDINYDMEQGVSGEGFVNVHNDFDTHQGPESITNCAYAKADLQEPVSDCATTKIVDPGTELLRREFGSGDYASEELLRLRTENKSIRSETSLSASHRPTSFALPGNRSLDYGTKWTEKSKAINTITGATMTEEYTFGSKIDKERVVDLDKNGSTMKTDVAFTGTGHIGVLKKEEPGSHPKIDPAYEAVEDYTGAFRIYEFVDEYGQSVRSVKNVSGYGYVAVDKRVGSSQRTYESGTGSYQSEELIETPTNYIAKDIQLVHGPTNYSYSPGFATSQNIKWSEGMWSRSGPLAGGLVLAQSSNCGSLEPTTNSNGTPPASLISERYSGLDYLNKETVASGLNEMNTEASFSGTADYRVKAIFSNKSGEIDNEERYVGAYAITRRVQLTGVSRYDRPHITVTKDGKMTKRYFNKTMADIMEYTITLTNDGSRSLGPINIRDIFPPGTEYISSSIRPASYSNAEANWTLLNLGIGGSLTLKLELNVTEFAPCSLVNRVMVCGMNGEECVAGAAYHARDCGELPCCPPDLVLDKSADQDPTDPALIHYTIAVQNKGNSSLAATLTDLLPSGLDYVDASPKPARIEGQFLQWIVPDLEKDGLMTIEYHVRATMDGVYVNAVHADASAVDGSGYDTADAAAKVEVRSTGVAPKTTRYGGWQVPDWNMTSPEQGITVELSPEEDVVE